MNDKDKQKYNFLANAHPRFTESLYRQYREDPESVDPQWRAFFSGYEYGWADAPEKTPSFKMGSGADVSRDTEFKAIALIEGYRRRGHLFTKTNPVRTRRAHFPTLDIKNFGLSDNDLDKEFMAGHETGLGPAPLRAIIAQLEETYCKSIGVEYLYIRSPEKVQWLKERMESTRNRPDFSLEEKRRILAKLTEAVVFENFLHTRFTGHKRFSISGGESIVPGLDVLIEHGAELGVREFVIGMAHRGRLNILVNILKKPYHEIFAEFEGKDYSDDIFVGDVKYHLGYTNNIRTRRDHSVILNMTPNPSHLEAVTPYVQGVARSKIENKYQGNYDQVVPILIHGDAAVAGQGIVYEVIQMSLLEGYRTGGAIHIIINNQLGFTTNYTDARSSTYCTDIAKVTLSPVFHVNADDSEAVAVAVKMAMDYRRTFHTDVFIDLLGYRKYGHNESDEPRFTQPTLYKEIARHPDPRTIYFGNLRNEGAVGPDEAQKLEKAFREVLEAELQKAKGYIHEQPLFADDCDLQKRPADNSAGSEPETAVHSEQLAQIARNIFTIPPEIQVIDKIRQIYDNRLNLFFTKHQCDWAMGEALAYGTLLAEGVNVRISGQDVERGTFSHRHAVLLVENTEEEYIPLRGAAPRQGRFSIYNSPLSEYGVLGYEFGYACVTPGGLTIWEAQFGDFANGAQITIDEYVTSSEAKWGKLNCLVMLLPHGYEGQGPDHSSARIERFLQLCANDNMEVANCTTPANFFHLLRRHIRQPFHVPLVVFSPKSLLRHPKCVSSISDFTSGKFQPVIGDSTVDGEKAKRVLLCSGKIYYELLEYREKNDIRDTAVIRVEQLYPWPMARLYEALASYPETASRIWVQEEPENMGVWGRLTRKWPFPRPGLVARRENSSPASGFYQVHLREQQSLVKAAFNGLTPAEKGIVFIPPGS